LGVSEGLFLSGKNDRANIFLPLKTEPFFLIFLGNFSGYFPRRNLPDLEVKKHSKNKNYQHIENQKKHTMSNWSSR